MSTIKNIGNLVILDDTLTEATDGQYIQFTLEQPNGTPVVNAAIVSIMGSLRSTDQNTTVFTNVNLQTTNRATFPSTDGIIRVTFKATDMISIGPNEVQRRELSLVITHSVNKVFVCGARFNLVCLTDV